MTQRETEAVIEMLDTCEEPVEVKAERAEGVAGTDTSGPAAAGEATATPTLMPELEPEENTSVYGSCEEAVEAGESRVQGSVGGGRGFTKEMVPSGPRRRWRWCCLRALKKRAHPTVRERCIRVPLN